MTNIYGPMDWVGRDAVIIAPNRRRDLAEEDLDQETIVTDPKGSCIHKLNAIAMGVWRMCDERRSTRTIAEWLTDVYEVDLEDAMDYVDQLIARFAEAGLLESGS